MSDQCVLGARPRATEHEAARGRKPAGRNDAKSRGPKTARGKARSAQNALKHGLRAHRFVLLADEDTAAFQALEAARCTPSWRPRAPCRPCSSRGSL